MRKKQHKQINPRDKNYDRFYVINYLVNVHYTNMVSFKTRDKNRQEIPIINQYIYHFNSHRK